MSEPKPMPSYWALAEEVTHLHGKLDKLESENAKLREELEAVGTAAYLYGRSDLLAENAKLREEIAKARDPQRIGGQADPESFVYAIEQLREFRWQHATNDEDAIPYINNVVAAHERENAKLRELCEEMFAEHRRLYYSQGILRGQSASSRQMARWHEVGTKLGLDVWGERKEVDQ